MEEEIKKYKYIQFGLLAEWLPIPWHRRHGVRLSFYIFLQIFLLAFLLAVPQKGQAEADGNAGMKAEFANPLGMPSAAPGIDQSAKKVHADAVTKAHYVDGEGEKKTVVARVKKKKESGKTLRKVEPKSKAATVEKDAIKMGPDKEEKVGQNAIKMGPDKEKEASTRIDADSVKGKRMKRQIKGRVRVPKQIDSSNLNIDEQLNVLKNDGENVTLNLTDANTPWNMTFTLNPFEIACNDQQDAAGTELNPKTCMEMHLFCNEDGTKCSWEEVEDEDGCEKETSEQRNDRLKMQCKDVDNKFQSNFTRQYVVCYESALDNKVEGKRMKPQFSLHNNKNNSLANFCPEKWHGFGQIFWVTKEKEDDENLFVHSIIHFSFTNQTLKLPTIKMPIITNGVSEIVQYSIKFDIISTYSFGMDGPETDYPWDGAAKFLANGRHAFQNIAGLWSIFLDIANSSNLRLYFPKESICEIKIDGRSAQQECRESDEEIEKINKKFEEIEEILAEIHRLGKICSANRTTTSPTTDPQLQNLTNISLGIGVENGDDEKTMYGDVFPTKEKALAWLEEARKECQHLLNSTETSRVKRQIGEEMFAKYTNMTNFKWSKNYWDPKQFPIAYAFAHYEYKEWKEDVEMALKMISDKTCIAFKYYTRAAVKKNEYFLQFYNFPRCQTDGLGRNELGGERPIRVGFQSCPRGTIAHEVMHTLGFEHEQIRSDRDDSVWIRDDAIKPNENARYQYKKVATKNFNTPYDFGSVMHYGPWDFGVKGAGYTIVAKQRAYQHTMRQRVAPSFKDIKLLNRIYCSEKCENKLVCANGGYTDPKDCSKCRCPPGFGGKHCDRYDRGKRNCYSGRYYADTMQKHIVVSELMNGARKCHWTIKTVQIKQRILLTVYWLDNFECTHPCDENGHLEIQMLKDKSSRGARLCCGTSDYMPYTMELEPGVDALITLRRSNDKQRFGLIYETPDAIVPAEKLTYSQGCFCNGLYNPWHKPGDTHVDHLNKPIIYGLSINTETNFIINGKYRIHTQNGSVWFTRHCAKTSDSVNAFSMWEEPINGSVVRIDHIVAEPCVTDDYENSGCKELNDKWKKFVECLKRNPHECEKKFPNFRIQICGN